MTDSIFTFEDISEDVWVEAKRAGGRSGKGELPNDVWETYSAFANTDGGTIYLGVAEKQGEFLITGIQEPGRVLHDFWAQINNPQKINRNLLYDASVIQHPAGNGRWVIEINVPRASRKDRPVYINGNPITGTYKRNFSGDYRCTEEEVKRMLAEQGEDERDARILIGFNFDDVDMEGFKAYRNRLAALKPDHPYNGSDNPTFMRQIGGWRKDRTSGEEGLTLAGLLMFGRFESIHEVVRTYFVDYRELPANGSRTEWVDRLTPDGTWSGNLYGFYRSTIQRLFRDIKVPFRLAGDERDDETPVHKALREALVNAIVHADYAARVSILIVKAPGYFGFRNPGRMRIPVEVALEGGHSDCRNRSLQRMFSLIGLGEQAGSGIPRVIENWKTQHYRLPELWESQEPESTLMRLRTVSLLPDDTLDALRLRFGAAFDHLDEHGRVAMATAEIEGFVNNARMQQICRLHPRDITTLLKKLVDGGFLVPDGRGRATTYRIEGSEAVDLAGVPVGSLAAAEDFAVPAASSEHSPRSSEHSPSTSEHLPQTSEHLEAGSAHTQNKANEITTDPVLRETADPVRSNRRVSPATTRKVILELCRGRFLTLNQLAALLDRSSDGLRQRFVKPMVDEEKVLERRFPQQPNHESQAYRTRES